MDLVGLGLPVILSGWVVVGLVSVRSGWVGSRQVCSLFGCVGFSWLFCCCQVGSGCLVVGLGWVGWVRFGLQIVLSGWLVFGLCWVVLGLLVLCFVMIGCYFLFICVLSLVIDSLIKINGETPPDEKMNRAITIV